jgi:hypothetical protein
LRQKDEDEDVCSFTKHAKELEKKNTARGLTKSLLLIVKETLNVLLLTKIVKQCIAIANTRTRKAQRQRQSLSKASLILILRLRAILSMK